MFINFIGQLLFKIKFTCHNSSVSVVFHVKGFDLHARYFRVQYMVTVHRDQRSSFHSVISLSVCPPRSHGARVQCSVAQIV